MLDDNFELPKLKTDEPSKPEPEKKELDVPAQIDVTPNVEENNLSDLPSLKETDSKVESDLDMPQLAPANVELPEIINIDASDSETPLEIPITIEEAQPNMELPTIVEETPPIPELETPEIIQSEEVQPIESPAPLENIEPLAEPETQVPVELVNLEEESFEEFIPVEPTTPAPPAEVTPQAVEATDVTPVEAPVMEEIAIEPSWAEKPIKKKTKDPVVIIFTFLIIAAIVAAAVYFFMSQGLFSNDNPSNNQNNQENNDNQTPLALYGLYEGERGAICPNEVQTLEINSDNTFTLVDLMFDGEDCETFTFEGTFIREDNIISLTIFDDESVEAVFTSTSTSAEIRINFDDEDFVLTRSE